MSQHKNTSLINPFTLATAEPMQRVLRLVQLIRSQVIKANDDYNFVLVIIDAFQDLSKFILLSQHLLKTVYILFNG